MFVIVHNNSAVSRRSLGLDIRVELYLSLSYQGVFYILIETIAYACSSHFGCSNGVVAEARLLSGSVSGEQCRSKCDERR